MNSFLILLNIDYLNFIQYKEILSTIDIYYEKLKVINSLTTTINLKKVVYVEEVTIIINRTNSEEMSLFSKVRNF